MIQDSDIVLACIAPPSVFNFYPSREIAEQNRERANRDSLARGPYTVMTWLEYEAAQRAFYLSGPEEEITREKFTDMLEVLPPMAWKSSGSFESFLMCEYFSVPYTHQYIRRGAGEQARFYSKLVDATDRSTWMTA